MRNCCLRIVGSLQRPYSRGCATASALACALQDLYFPRRDVLSCSWFINLPVDCWHLCASLFCCQRSTWQSPFLSCPHLSKLRAELQVRSALPCPSLEAPLLHSGYPAPYAPVGIPVLFLGLSGSPEAAQSDCGSECTCISDEF